MTITEAAEKHGIPKSRVERAISRGLLHSERKGRARHITENQMDKAMKLDTRITQDRNKVVIIESESLLQKKQKVEIFATTAAATEFVILYKRSIKH